MVYAGNHPKAAALAIVAAHSLAVMRLVAHDPIYFDGIHARQFCLGKNVGADLNGLEVVGRRHLHSGGSRAGNFRIEHEKQEN